MMMMRKQVNSVHINVKWVGVHVQRYCNLSVRSTLHGPPESAADISCCDSLPKRVSPLQR